jgi:vancomycin resistance protein VanJ
MPTPQPNFFSRLLIAAKNVFIVFTGAYGLNVILFLLARIIIGEYWIVIAFFNTIAHLLWLPDFILLPIMLLMRRWFIAALLVPSIVMFVWVYGQQLIPNTVETPPNATILKVLTHNIYAGNTDTDTIINMIRAFDADIVALQETNYPMIQAFQQELREEYPYQASHPQESLVQGMAFLSRYPITSDEYWRYDWLLSPLAHQRVQIQMSETQSIVVYNAHPTHPGMNDGFFNPSWRSRELADILGRIRAETLPVVWLGDFNMPHLSDDYRRITGSMEDVYHSVGQGMGWTFLLNPMRIALLRLDYVFISPQFVAIESAVGKSSGGSDHLPLWATIALPYE